jgi:hypothetical protein
MFRNSRTARRLLATAAVLVLGGAGVGYSAFSSTAASDGNHFATGTVALSSNGSGGGALSISNGRPGDTTTACISVAYTGSRDANVHFYALKSTSGNDAAPYLSTTVEVGSFSGATPANNSCAGFTPSSSLFSGKLAGLPSTYQAGLVDPNASWHNGDTAVYKVTVTVDDTDSAQNTSADADLRWEARSNA